MKFKFGIAILICLIALVGCSKDKYNLQDVNNAFKSQNLILGPYGLMGTIPTLNKVIPEMNSIEGQASVDHSDHEFVYFYIFKTESARKSGVKEIKNEMKNAKFTTYPFLYEKGNVLTIYWAKSKEKPLFNDSIKLAIDKL
ncbi:hypothetical protein Back11_03560 [Paenibacillus baekrokdamisoli]|uniref:Uncharacterized protein n=1 Tax=Paenibacillus baekrokdamisoli TaxID=1712516 RepID=A0A3G9IZG4_9BACL|nr:hypothetical protein [Paenibacillus baekrokdamisoli]MBB3073525.1 hypothetical protein [Paenibacillus baekrokdamisoli]BBH19011.1 hypothetical protein Back11_03560 [Paenibacillus baekrokdamisoli]